jgi:hypothetical protein
LLTDFSKRLLKEISKCDVISENLVISEILGPISPDRVGSGVKAVLYMMYEENKEKYGYIDIHWCGDNLIPFIREVCSQKDVGINCDRMFPYLSSRYGKFNGGLKVVNTGHVFYSGLDFFMEFGSIEEKYRNEMQKRK